MSNHNWATPEDIERIKKRKKAILYASIPVITIILTTSLTLLLN